MIGLLARGRSGESPWLWLVIPALGLVSYLFGRARSRKTGQPMQRIGGLGYAPWYVQAVALALMGGGSLYHLATGHDHWYWWFLPAAAWLGFARVVVTRKPE